MNRSEIEALLYRIQDAFPSAQPPRPGTIDEWASSSIQYQPAALVFAAFDDWREVEQWPPTIAQMIEATQEKGRQVARIARETEEARARIEQRELEQADYERSLDEQPTLPGVPSARDQVRAIIAEAKEKVARARHAPPKPRHCPTCGQSWPLERPSDAELRAMGLKGAL